MSVGWTLGQTAGEPCTAHADCPTNAEVLACARCVSDSPIGHVTQLMSALGGSVVSPDVVPVTWCVFVVCICRRCALCRVYLQTLYLASCVFADVVPVTACVSALISVSSLHRQCVFTAGRRCVYPRQRRGNYFEVGGGGGKRLPGVQGNP